MPLFFMAITLNLNGDSTEPSDLVELKDWDPAVVITDPDQIQPQVVFTSPDEAAVAQEPVAQPVPVTTKTRK